MPENLHSHWLFFRLAHWLNFIPENPNEWSYDRSQKNSHFFKKRRNDFILINYSLSRGLIHSSQRPDGPDVREWQRPSIRHGFEQSLFWQDGYSRFNKQGPGAQPPETWRSRHGRNDMTAAHFKFFKERNNKFYNC